MAQGRFGQVPSFHRYRVVVPLMAGTLAQLLLWLRSWAGSPPAGFALGFSFYVVNTVLLALAGTFIYRTARVCGAVFGNALFGAAVVLSSGIATYLTGSALVDSLAICLVSLVFYALTAEQKHLLWWSLLGLVLAKDQLALYYGRCIAWPQRLAAAALSVGLAMLLRYQVDLLYHLPASLPNQGIVPVIASHIRSHILSTSLYLLTWKGMGDALVTFGGFTLLLLAGCTGGQASRRAWLTQMPPASGALLVCAALFIVLSGDVARMLFFASPCFGVAVALIVQYHPAATTLRQKLQDAAH